MRRPTAFLDYFLIGGFVASLFNGFLNPLYVTHVLARLDGSVVATGTLLASSLPLAVGALLGRRVLFRRLYALLPVLMGVELAALAGSVAAAAVNVAAYYLLSMLVFGLFTTSVVYLLQKAKERRYRRGRSAFDRRCAMADAGGCLAGSALFMSGVLKLNDPVAIAVVGVLQTAIVYGLFVLAYRRAAPARGRSADEEPHPRRFQAPDTACAAAAA
jgi:hypothetical protein